ncbi:hypothetical protein HDU67_001136 [Dinochytrium kinnereticum]|nr:hypothetical protein HDU67_001136 [Dinochytrium kinnereticum]
MSSASSNEDEDASDLDDFDAQSQYSGHTSITPALDAGRELRVRVRNKPQQQFSEVKMVHQVPGNQGRAGKAGSIQQSPHRRDIGYGITGSGDNSSRVDETYAQEVIYGGVVVLKFSRSGRYLAATEGDAVLKLWIFDSDKKRKEFLGKSRAEDPDSISSGFNSSRDLIPRRPDRILKGHIQPILDISWSKNDFILTSSLDSTVRLWHASTTECLAIFNHSSPVFSVSFHPSDDRFFISGDSRLRLWSVVEKKVLNWVDIPRSKGVVTNTNNLTRDKDAAYSTIEGKVASLHTSHITAVGFNRDGSLVIAGTVDGELYFYETEGLRYNTQVEITISRTRSSKGPRIVGIFAAPSPKSEDRILVTANDSNLRLYNLRDKSLIRKYRGPEVRSSFTKASFSETGHFIICGSENRRVYLVNTEAMHAPNGLSVGSKKTPSLEERSSLKNVRSRKTRRYTVDNRVFSESRLPGLTGVLNGLMSWNNESARHTQYEAFVASSEAVVCACFVPDWIAEVWDMQRGKTSSQLNQSSKDSFSSSSCYILTSDAIGAINVFECKHIRANQNDRDDATTKSSSLPESMVNAQQEALSDMAIEAQLPTFSESPVASLHPTAAIPHMIITKPRRQFENERNHFCIAKSIWKAGIYDNSLDFSFGARTLAHRPDEIADLANPPEELARAAHASEGKEIETYPKDQSLPRGGDVTLAPSAAEKFTDPNLRKGTGLIKAIRNKMSRGATVGALARPAFLSLDGPKRSLSSLQSTLNANKDAGSSKLPDSLPKESAESQFVTCVKCGDIKFTLFKDGRILCINCTHIADPNLRRFYIGTTPDPKRRLRQHNGELKGGAVKTERHRPSGSTASKT